LGLVPALRWYTNRYAQRTHIAVEFETDGLDERLSYATETALYRVIQEALTNVARHARAEHVHVHLRRIASRITAVVRDDGRGFNLGARPGHDTPSLGVGLLGMRERVSLLGGSFRIDSRPGQGTCISAEIPLKGEPRA